MSGSEVILRKATREDIERFSDMPVKPSARAYVAEQNGEIIALYGLAFIGGRWFAFCDLKPEARLHKIKMVRAGKQLIADAYRDGIRFIYAQVDKSEANSTRWLSSLGFKLDPRSQVLYRWSASTWQH